MPYLPRNRARFDTQTGPPSTVVVIVLGELDAANTDEFSAYIELRLRNADNLVLDLTGVEFFAAESFSSIHKVGVQAAAEGVQWSMLTSAAVDRMLQICDPDHALSGLRAAS